MEAIRGAGSTRAAPGEVVEEARRGGWGPSVGRPGAGGPGGPGSPGTSTGSAAGAGRAGLDRRRAAPARLARRPYTARDPRVPSPATRSAWRRLARTSVAADVDEAGGVGLGEVADGGERAQLPGPHHLPPVHVAEAAEHPLVEQHLGAPWPGRRRRPAAGRTQRPRSASARAEVRGRAPRRPGWRMAVRPAIRLDRGGVEAHGHPARRPRSARAAWWWGRCHDSPARWRCHAPPRRRLVWRIDPVVPLDLEAAAVALDPLDPLDRAPGPGRQPDEAGSIEAEHLLVDQRRAQCRRGVVDALGFVHRPPTVGAVAAAAGDPCSVRRIWRRRAGSAGQKGSATAVRRSGPGRGGSGGRGRPSSARGPRG